MAKMDGICIARTLTNIETTHINTRIDNHRHVLLRTNKLSFENWEKFGIKHIQIPLSNALDKG